MFEAVSVASKSSKAKVDVLVLGHFKGQGLSAACKKFDVGGAAASAAKRAEATGELGSIAEAFPSGRGAPGRVILLGLGDKKSFEVGSLRNAAASLGKRLARTKDGSAQIELDGAINSAKKDVASASSAFGEGLGLLSWNFTHLQGTARD